MNEEKSKYNFNQKELIKKIEDIENSNSAAIIIEDYYDANIEVRLKEINDRNLGDEEKWNNTKQYLVKLVDSYDELNNNSYKTVCGIYNLMKDKFDSVSKMSRPEYVAYYYQSQIEINNDFIIQAIENIEKEVQEARILEVKKIIALRKIRELKKISNDKTNLNNNFGYRLSREESDELFSTIKPYFKHKTTDEVFYRVLKENWSDNELILQFDCKTTEACCILSKLGFRYFDNLSPTNVGKSEKFLSKKGITKITYSNMSSTTYQTSIDPYKPNSYSRMQDTLREILPKH